MPLTDSVSWIEAESPPLTERFEALAEAWKSTKGPSSTIADRALHPAYQQIIGLGPGAVPLLLRELEREPDHWFWALKSITGIDPVPESDRGNVAAMTNAWLKWGREHGWLP